jgi:hypothetical protein
MHHCAKDRKERSKRPGERNQTPLPLQSFRASYTAVTGKILAKRQ